MTYFKDGNLDPLFHPVSIALAGITVDNPEHWTRTFLDSLLEFKFEGPLYLVNPKGGEIGGIKVHQSFADIAGDVDYVISTVPAGAAPGLIEECAHKGVKAVHFCTAGFRETGEEEGAILEPQLVEASRRTGIRIIGPNCMGIYCPGSRISFNVDFPKESGPVGFISQSGGNTGSLVQRVKSRGIRFSKVVSYGNACDLNECDFLEYLAADSETKIIGLYIEGVRDGKRFRQALRKAAEKKAVILLKGGLTEGGAGAAAGHTGSLAGNEVIWDSLCRQSGVIQVHSLEEFADCLVTLRFMPDPGGRRVALIGAGGGSSVLIADEFERCGLRVPPLPGKIRERIREFTPVAGNILRNPIDYS
ncbi:MAG: CoA-binding protein [Deltaproteobacteria bacterium]|nr:CoA-binding protein [Deltaproteobacteria bacterium]